MKCIGENHPKSIGDKKKNTMQEYKCYFVTLNWSNEDTPSNGFGGFV